ncbi:MAG: outer membrane protein assembly factor BamE [Gammaproteobacteria bacterium]|jgi:outer membrane protein assembly factor BamE
MRKVLILFFMVLISGCLFGCHMYRPDVQQGNVVSQKMASRLHFGMSQAAAKRILGEPLLINVFANNRLDYVYTYKHGNQPMTERQIILTFSNNRLVRIRKKLG